MPLKQKTSPLKILILSIQIDIAIWLFTSIVYFIYYPDAN